MPSIIKQASQPIKATKPITPTTLKGRAARNSGYAAEEAACIWLIKQGLTIVERNVRYRFGEIDIVAWQGETLVLFEVRLRQNNRFGTALDSITPTKQRRLWAAAQAYAAQFKNPPPMRIDVLAYSTLTTTQGIATPHWVKNISA